MQSSLKYTNGKAPTIYLGLVYVSYFPIYLSYFAIFSCETIEKCSKGMKWIASITLRSIRVK